MIGNDIIDLFEENKHLINQRYIKRTLNDLEEKYFKESKNKTHCFACLWSVKEAAYKAIQRTHLDFIFSPPTIALTENSLVELLNHDINKKFVGKAESSKYPDLKIHVQIASFKTATDNKTTDNKTTDNKTTDNKAAAIHAVASLSENAINTCIQAVENHTSKINQSVAVRQLAQKIFANQGLSANIQRPEISIKKNDQKTYTKAGPPVITFQSSNQHSTDIISLSHDGQWLAVVYLAN